MAHEKEHSKRCYKTYIFQSQLHLECIVLELKGLPDLSYFYG